MRHSSPHHRSAFFCLLPKPPKWDIFFSAKEVAIEWDAPENQGEPTTNRTRTSRALGGGSPCVRERERETPKKERNKERQKKDRIKDLQERARDTAAAILRPTKGAGCAGEAGGVRGVVQGRAEASVDVSPHRDTSQRCFIFVFKSFICETEPIAQTRDPCVQPVS